MHEAFTSLDLPDRDGGRWSWIYMWHPWSPGIHAPSVILLCDPYLTYDFPSHAVTALFRWVKDTTIFCSPHLSLISPQHHSLIDGSYPQAHSVVFLVLCLLHSYTETKEPVQALRAWSLIRRAFLLALAGLLSGLEHCPHMPKLWVGSLAKEHIRSSQWMHTVGWATDQCFSSLSFPPALPSLLSSFSIMSI